MQFSLKEALLTQDQSESAYFRVGSSGIGQREAFRLCRYPVDESRAIVSPQSMFAAVFTMHARIVKWRSGHLALKC